MSNLLQSFYDFAIHDPELSTLLGTRVFRDKATSTTITPFLVYGTEKSAYPLGVFSNEHGVRKTNLSIDIVGDSVAQDALDDLRNLLVTKLGGFQGALTTDWQGGIEINQASDFYDADTERSVRRLELMCTEVY